MKKIRVDIDMLICALEDHSFGTDYYLDTRTGEIAILSELDMPEEEELRESIETEEDRYIYIAPIESSESFRVMERFVEELPEGKAKRDLANALSQGKPFRRFKDALYDHPEIRENWFLFHDKELKKMAQEWLHDNDIDAELPPLQEGRR